MIYAGLPFGLYLLFGPQWFVWATLAAVLVQDTFVHFSAVMNLQRARDTNKLTKLQRPFGYTALGVGLILDVTLNVLACIFVLWTLPRDALLTMTLIRYKRNGPGTSRLSRWRYKVSSWVCAEMLDTLDPHPSGCHCRID
jgi:hypothetical protein